MVDQSHLAENIIQIYKKHGRAWTELRGDFLYEKLGYMAFFHLFQSIPIFSI